MTEKTPNWMLIDANELHAVIEFYRINENHEVVQTLMPLYAMLKPLTELDKGGMEKGGSGVALSNEAQNPASCQTAVSRSFSLMVLEAEYHKLKLEIFKAEKEMALSPNEYSHNFLNGYKPHLQDLEKAISVLQNCT